MRFSAEIQSNRMFAEILNCIISIKPDELMFVRNHQLPLSISIKTWHASAYSAAMATERGHVGPLIGVHHVNQ